MFARMISLMFFMMLTRVAFAGDFVDNFDSVPLLKGFEVNIDEGFVFDKPEGRVASASAYGKVKAAKVMAYYKEVLPEFGWRLVKPYLFYREGEYLMIETIQENDFTVIIFLNFPKLNGDLIDGR